MKELFNLFLKIYNKIKKKKQILLKFLHIFLKFC